MWNNTLYIDNYFSFHISLTNIIYVFNMVWTYIMWTRWMPQIRTLAGGRYSNMVITLALPLLVIQVYFLILFLCFLFDSFVSAKNFQPQTLIGKPKHNLELYTWTITQNPRGTINSTWRVHVEELIQSCSLLSWLLKYFL